MGDYVLLKNETLVATNANGEVMLGDYIQPSPSPSVTPSISISQTPTPSISVTPSITPSITPSPSQVPVNLILRYIGGDVLNANRFAINNLTYTWTDGSITEPLFTWKGSSNRTETTSSFNLKNMVGSSISRDIKIDTFVQASYLESIVVQIYINTVLYDTKSTTGMHDALTTTYESDNVILGDIPVNPGDTLEIRWTDTIQ